MTQIGFIRHGITDWNIEKRAQGQTDIPLNETGRKQAKALANRLQHEHWDVMYSSDLSRAAETANIVAQALGLTVHTDKRLREMSCGLLEGTTVEERIEKWGADWNQLQLGVESDDAIAQRGLSFIEYINQRYPNQKILIVSHGAYVGKTLKKLIPHVDTEEHLHNTSLTILHFQNNNWDCSLYNCVKHDVVNETQ